MVKHILPLIPPHLIYCEPFFGGGAVFFAKKPAKNNAINDINDMAINFYRVLKNHFVELNEMIQGTLHSESEYRRAKELLMENKGTDIERAWAFWVQTNMSFGKKMFAGFAFNKGNVNKKPTSGEIHEFKTTNNRKKRFTHYAHSLEQTEIFNRDALSVIGIKDTVQTFHYIDPPYYNSDCGYYDGYTIEDFEALLKQLESIEGKFLLSCYPSELLEQYRERNGWQSMDIVKNLSVDGKGTEGKKKTECLTWNYALESDKQQTLF